MLPAARREEADAPRVQRVVRWMRRQEVRVYSQADAVATVSAHDAAWILGHLEAASLVDPDDLPEGFGGRPSREVGVLPFIAWPAPPADATPDATPLGRRQGLLYVGVAHTAASQSMRWFLREVHPLIQTKLRAKGLNESAAAEMGRLRIVGWGWKEHARKGPGCTRDSRVVGRGARCAGTQLFLPRRGPGKEQGQEPGQPPVAAVDAGDAGGDEDDGAEPAAGAPLSQEASSLAVVHAPPPIEWYYMDLESQQQGPVNEDELRRLYNLGDIHEFTFVWHDAMGEWAAIRDQNVLPSAGGDVAAAHAGGLQHAYC